MLLSPEARAHETRGRGPAKALLLSCGTIALLALCLLAGRYPKPGLLDPRLLGSDATARAVLLSSRLPRLCAALLLGAVLASAGNAFQMVFGNPLVEPGFLGVSQGAALGAAIALVANAGSEMAVTTSAFALALAALAAASLLARAFPFGGWVLRLILAGLAVSAFMQSGLAVVKYAADPLRELPDIVYWTMGSLSGVSWKRLAFASVPGIAAVAFLELYRWRITLLSADEAVVASLGLRPVLSRAAVLVAASAGVAAVVAMAGAVSWIGLVVPQAARLAAGADARRSMPLSALMGALFAALCDTLARSLFPGELPLGAVTAALGSMAFAVMLLRGKLGIAK
jgi:iron complex transport system permease protein